MPDGVGDFPALFVIDNIAHLNTQADIISGVMSDISFTVVIPTLNEEFFIRRCINAVRIALPSAEIIVTDGGSNDQTLRIAKECGVRLIRAATGRGPQCNSGAASATGDVILFLHADTLLPPDAGEYLHDLFSNTKVKIGTFSLYFDHKHWLLMLISFYTSRHHGKIRFGDACITVRKDFFNLIGGFPNQRLFEDLELLRRADKITRLYRFPLKITTSARRLNANGPIKQSLLNFWYTIRYLTGTPADELANNYERTNRRLDKCSLLMMVRYPEPGKVKTRLAAGLSQDRAADFYRQCAEQLFAAADQLPGHIEKVAYISDANDISRVVEWTGGKYKIKTQPSSSLGSRLEDGFATEFRNGATAVIITASDVPDIDTDILETAFRALKKYDLVIGPSPDGGYYLIGLNKPAQRLFRNMPWSSGKVLKNTLKIAGKLGYAIHTLPTLRDIDTAEDWKIWKSLQEAGTSLIKDGYVPIH
ncbi:MAG: TIGR04283 family arsenosugar biosynthesis glycosyltransferase [Dehalogenimonas sp.]